MFDYGPYVSLIVSLATAVLYAVLAWKISGEQFSEQKFLRTVTISFLMALGFSVSGTPLDSIYVSPFASTLVGVIISKFINSQTATDNASMLQQASTQPQQQQSQSTPAASEMPNGKQNVQT